MSDPVVLGQLEYLRLHQVSESQTNGVKSVARHPRALIVRLLH